MKYKALMLDLDGTTIPNKMNGMPSKKVTEAIAKAKDHIHIGIATGRHLEIVQPIIDHLELSGPVILSGGAQIFDVQTRKYIREKPLSKETAQDVLTILKPFKSSIYIFERERNMLFEEGCLSEEPFTLLVDDVSDEQADEIITTISHIPTISTHKIVSWIKGRVCINISHVYATKQHCNS